MNKLIYITLGIIALTMSACKGNTYSKALGEEKKLIKDYIKRQGINVLQEEPEVYGDKDYYMVAGYDNLYFHLVTMGDTSMHKVEQADIVTVRYKKYTLTPISDTTSYWTTDDGGYPIEFTYGDNTNESACQAWHAAIKLMAYPGAVCKIICPSKLGFADDNNSVTPYGYTMTFKIKH